MLQEPALQLLEHLASELECLSAMKCKTPKLRSAICSARCGDNSASFDISEERSCGFEPKQEIE
jgi:hypothetical protein